MPRSRTKPARISRNQTRSAAATFSFSAEQDAQYALGWPHLRRIVDGPPPRGGVAKPVLAELKAGDPEFAVDVQRDVARGFLRAMMLERSLDPGPRARAMVDPRPIDDAVLAAIVERLCPSMTEIYSFRVHDAVFLLEAWLGTERVAQALVERFVIAAAKPALWSAKANSHNHAFALAHALGFMRLRLPPARWDAIIAPLRAVKPTRLLFTERLRLLVDRKLAVRQNTEAMSMITLDVLLERGDVKGVRAWLAEARSYWYSPRVFYIAGADLLDRSPMDALPRLPAWQQQRIVAEYGTIRHRATVRVMMWLLSGRSARKQAAAWLQEHADFARPVLAELRAGTDAREATLATTAVATLGGGPVANKRLTPAQVTKEVDVVMARIEKALVAAKGKRAAELAALKAAFARYSEARAAGGDYIPDAYFMHHLAEVPWKSSGPTVSRWLDLAIEAMR